ncbi:MAG: hypothetical protein HDT20_05600 [Oscillibacter sp.]|nr:hypothetical protein [Oscillibacter sp.]
MRTLPITAGLEEIRALVVEWNELLANEKYYEALSSILYDNTQEIDGETWIWTPEKLEAAVYTYGQPWYTKEDIKRLYGADCQVDYKVTSILNCPNKESCLKNIDIDIFDYTVSPEIAKTWSITKLDYKNIIGDVFFNNVLLNGEPSDLTALFWIVKVSDNSITLIFRDLHMM